MQLLPCRTIGNLRLKKNNHLRIILINDEMLIPFTPTEYQIFLLLLENEIVEDQTLATIFHTDTNTRAKRTLEKHIEKMRSKLKPASLFIRRIYLSGYMLVVKDNSIAS